MASLCKVAVQQPLRVICPVRTVAKKTIRCSVSFKRLRHSSAADKQSPNFAFAFDIDGVLLRGHNALPKASKTLNLLLRHRIPFLLLTNGGGYHESKRAEFLSKELDCTIDDFMVIQSHTPFQDETQLKEEKTVLVVGGDGGNCKEVARRYGYKNILTPSDIFTTYPSIWPFSKPLSSYHDSFASTTTTTASSPAQEHPITNHKIDAIHVYNDPRDWGLDLTILLDLLLSSQGYLGTLSSTNNNASLPNHGFLQDGQPKIYFSNPDLWWAAEFPLPRLGQGGFRAALEGLWRTVTAGKAVLGEHVVQMGKPTGKTFEFAERRLLGLRQRLNAGALREKPKGSAAIDGEQNSGNKDERALKNVYMIGDNPASDIKGANDYKSQFGSQWSSVLVRTGVYNERNGSPDPEPTIVVDDVGEGVEWALRREGWDVEERY